jgi:DNA repair exonuclease SbcCD ATPase subunit
MESYENKATPQSLSAKQVNFEKGKEAWLSREIAYWETAHDRVMSLYLEVQTAHDKWKKGHDDLLRQFEQWKAWYTKLEEDRNRYVKWDQDKKQEIDKLRTAMEALQKARVFWESEHQKVVNQVQHWVSLYKGLEEDRNRLKKWDEEKNNEIVRLNKDINELIQAREFWVTEHTKVVGQVQQWVAWFKNMQMDRDSYKRMDEDKIVEIERMKSSNQELHAFVDALLDHPFYYLYSFLRRKLKGKK